MTGARRVLTGPPVTDFHDFSCRGGGAGLEAARHGSTDSTISLIEQSGLRGRGGAGFPTGRKLRSIADALAVAPADGIRHVVVNAAEGEPGSFKDRAIIRHNPYEVIEGACIAASALGATDVIVATKASFRREIERLDRAIEQMHSAGLTSGFAVRVVRGPSEYLYGEETAMLEVIDGRPPFPRIAPPYRRGIEDGAPRRAGASWADGPAVFVSNVETLANLPGIVRHGIDWLRSYGTAQSPGTIVCTVTGDTVRHGVGEMALGTPLRDVIEMIGGGVRGRRRAIAVLSGVSNCALAPGQLDTPLTYEDMAAAGSGLGSATFIVVDETRRLRSVAGEVARFLAVESCGQCEPCKRDGLAIAAALRDGSTDMAVLTGRLATVARGARCALAGQQERVVGGLLDMALHADEPIDERSAPFTIAPLVDIVDGRARLDLAHVDKRPDWSYAGEDPDSHAWPIERLLDHPVHIGRPHVEEARTAREQPAPAARPPRDTFDALRDIETRLEAEMAAVRRAAPDDRASALHDLRRALEHHRHITERLVYPLVRTLDTERGDDIAWYPQQHEQHADRLLRRLDIGDLPLAPNLIDELCADVHASIIELQRRVLPALDAILSSDEREELLVEAGVDELAADHR